MAVIKPIYLAVVKSNALGGDNKDDIVNLYRQSNIFIDNFIFPFVSRINNTKPLLSADSVSSR